MVSLLRIAIPVLIATFAAAACGASATESSADLSGLHDIGSVDELRAVFNGDEGTPRLLLLMSPT